MKARLIKETVTVRELSSGMFKSKNTVNRLQQVLFDKEPIETKNGIFIPDKPIKSSQLQAGDYIIGFYNSYNQGADVYQFNGFTGHEKKYGEGPVKFKNAKELFAAYGVKSYKELEEFQDQYEYGHASYMNVKDIDSGDEGSWFYLYKGRWARGTGAETLSFYLLKKQE